MVEAKGTLLSNERLRRAIGAAGLQLDDVAVEAGIDVKTAERWVTKGRLPHPRNRASVARLLGVDELELWPELTEQAARSADAADLLRVSPPRGGVPPALWYELIESARRRIDVLVYSGLFLL